MLCIVERLALVHDFAVRPQYDEAPFLCREIALGADFQGRSVRSSCHVGVLKAALYILTRGQAKHHPAVVRPCYVPGERHVLARCVDVS